MNLSKNGDYIGELMEIKMEDRNCDGCGISFKVMVGSMQTFHSNFCATGGAIWKKDQLKALKNAEFETNLRSESSGGFPNSEQKKQPIENEIVKDTQNFHEPDTMQTQKPLIKSEQKEGEKMSNEKENSSVSGTLETRNGPGQQLEKVESKETQPTGLTQLLISSDEEKYHMTSLIDSSANELHSQMKRQK